MTRWRREAPVPQRIPAFEQQSVVGIDDCGSPVSFRGAGYVGTRHIEKSSYLASVSS